MPERRGVGLRGRLTAFFVVITVLPVLVAVLALQVQIDRQLVQRSETELASVRQAAVSLLSAGRARAGDFASDLAFDLAGELSREPDSIALRGDRAGEGIEDFLERRAAPGIPLRADFAAVIGPEGALLGRVGREPRFADQDVDVDVEAIGAAATEGAPLPGALLEVRELQGAASITPIGWLVTGVWTDDELLDGLGIAGRAALVTDGDVLAASGADPEDVPAARSPTPGVVVAADADGEGDEVLLTSAPLADPDAGEADTQLVVWTTPPQRPSSAAVALLIVIPAVLLSAGVGYVIASAVVGPVRRAAAAARAIAGGDLEQHLEPAGGPELADLSRALNAMSAELAARLRELEQREEQLRGSLERLGQTLSSSLDLNRMLSVVVDTASETLHADRALLALFTPARDALYTKVGRGLDGAGPRVRLGQGLIGSVADHGIPVLVPSEVPAPEPASGEPVGASQLAVPLLVRGRVLGVLHLLRDDEGEPFTPADLETVRSFATQASVAIENVMLHQEAQRLSVTDPLTGLWNFRYFQLQAEREVGSAERSGRPLSLVVADIDHFKPVNDTWGHQVGDEVLIEVARRLRASTRGPDVVARYGGEEFVVLLPDTDTQGAAVTAERIRAAVGGERISPVVSGVTATTGGPVVEPLSITCSVGVATLPRHGPTVASLLRAADAAMYEAKQQGRNRVVLAEA